MTAKLEQALVQRFIDGNFGLPVAYENGDFDPTGYTDAYLDLSTFVNDETPFSMNYSDETDGYMQVIIRYPEGQLSWDAKNKKDEISKFFKFGRVPNSFGQKLQITRRSSDKGFNEDGWYKIVLRVFFTAVLPR